MITNTREEEKKGKRKRRKKRQTCTSNLKNKKHIFGICKVNICTEIPEYIEIFLTSRKSLLLTLLTLEKDLKKNMFQCWWTWWVSTETTARMQTWGKSFAVLIVNSCRLVQLKKKTKTDIVMRQSALILKDPSQSCWFDNCVLLLIVQK